LRNHDLPTLSDATGSLLGCCLHGACRTGT
jgi:hypothetical protein